MGWSVLPISAGGLRDDDVADEVKEAIDERADVVGTSKPSAINAGDLNKHSSVENYRSKIELLFSKFYKKSGSGVDTVFTSWTLATIMTECFGGGVTDWPNKNNKLPLSSHWNHMRTVINKLEWIRETSIHLGMGHFNCAYFDGFPYYVQGATADVCMDIYDAWGGAVIGISGALWAGCPTNFWTSGAMFLMEDRKDVHSILRFDIPNLSLLDTYLSAITYNKEYNEAPEQTFDCDVYLGTDTPGQTFAAIRSYGTLANSGMAKTITGYLDGARKSFQLGETKLAVNDTNYLRAKALDSCNREIDAGLWNAVKREWKQCIESSYDETYLFLQVDFAYKAA